MTAKKNAAPSPASAIQPVPFLSFRCCASCANWNPDPQRTQIRCEALDVTLIRPIPATPAAVVDRLSRQVCSRYRRNAYVVGTTKEEDSR